MTRPLVITSPLNPNSVAIYLMASVVGIAHLLGVAEARALTIWLGVPFANVWAVIMCIAPLAAVFGAIIIGKGLETFGLRIEGWSAFATAAAAGTYAVGLVHGYGMTVPVTFILTLIVTLGPLARAGQAWYELRRVNRGRAHPVAADPPPLGDPDDRR